MAFPAGLTLVTVTGQIAGIPEGLQGEVRFTCQQWLTGPLDDALVAPFTVRTVVDDQGEFSVELPATDDPDYTPQGWSYVVLLQYGVHVVRGTLTVPYNGGTFELADRVDLGGEVTAGVTYMQLSARGAAGGVAALDGTGKVPTAQLPASAGGAPAWDDITGKPSTFAPSTHSHPISQVTGLQTALDDLEGRVDDLEAAPGGGGGTVSTFARAVVTSGDFDAPADAAFAPVSGLTLALAAVAGDNVEVHLAGMIDYGTIATDYYDLVILVGGSIVRCASSGTATPSVEGDPSLYPKSGVRFGGVSTSWSLAVASGDLSGGNVTFALAHKGPGNSAVLASTYPFRWFARNDHQ